MAESLPLSPALWPFLLALELLDNSEVEINDLLADEDDIAFRSCPELLWRYDTNSKRSHLRMYVETYITKRQVNEFCFLTRV